MFYTLSVWSQPDVHKKSVKCSPILRFPQTDRKLKQVGTFQEVD
jgi:hypothetical protein